MTLTDFEKVMFIINFCSALIISYKGIFTVLNSMSKKTYFPVRLAWILMTTGAFAVLAAPIFGLYMTGTSSTLIHFGIAVFVFSDRRFFRIKNEHKL